MDIGNKITIIIVMLSLMGIGIIAMFNLGELLTPALSTAFRGTGTNIIWTIALRLLIAPLLIIIALYVIINVIKE